MLGILLAILKFIGIFLLGILFLLLFLLTVVLVSPIKYSLVGEKKEQIKANFAVGWLFGLLRIKGTYLEGKEAELTVKVLWFTLMGEKKKRPRRKAKKRPVHTGDVVVAREKPSPAQASAPKEEPSQGIYMAEVKPPKEEKPEPASSTAPLIKEETIPSATVSQEAPLPEKPKVRRVKLSEIKEPPMPIGEDFEEEAFFQEDRPASDAPSSMDELRSYWHKFKQIENKKEIYLALKKLLRQILRGILPNHLQVKATVGLGEPDYTGYFMGLVSVLTAKFGKNIQVKADFTRLVAEDIEVAVKGNLVAGYFLYSLLNFILKKPIRRILIKLWKGRKQNG